MSKKPDRLPVFLTIGNAFDSIFSRSVLRSRAVGQSFIALLIYNALAGFLARRSGAEMDLLIWLVSSFGLFLVMAPLSVTLHRHIILGEALSDRPFGEFFSGRNRQFAFYGLLITFPLLILQIAPYIVLAGLGGDSPTREEMLKGAYVSAILVGMIFPYLFVMVRFILVLPFIAIDDKRSVAHCWRLTGGQNWRFFGVVILLGLLLAIITGVAFVPIPGQSGENGLFAFLGDAVDSLILLFFVAITVAAVSHAFVCFTAKGLD